MNQIRSLMAVFVLSCSMVGCGPELAAVVPLATDAATVAGAAGGLYFLGKSIENVTLDTEKKQLEIEIIRDERSR